MIDLAPMRTDGLILKMAYISMDLDLSDLSFTGEYILLVGMPVEPVEPVVTAVTEWVTDTVGQVMGRLERQEPLPRIQRGMAGLVESVGRAGRGLLLERLEELVITVRTELGSGKFLGYNNTGRLELVERLAEPLEQQ